MRFYRIHIVLAGANDGQSTGYEWFTKRRDAEAQARSFRPPEFRRPEVEAIDIRSTKSGITEALRRYASHANNG